MGVQDCLTKMKNIQMCLFDYMNKDGDYEEFYQVLLHNIENYKICEEKHEFVLVLHLITHISNNYHRRSDFYPKIFKILEHYHDYVKKNFSKQEIISIFESNKRLLLFYIENKILDFDTVLFQKIVKNKFKHDFYALYFYPEVSLIDTIGYKTILEIDYTKNKTTIDNRKIGQNDSYICQLIQKDSVDEFINYVNKNNFDIKNTEIYPSPIETNRFLIRRIPKLIEYSAFYGSLKIFKYLLMNNAELSPSLWLYAIHGSNPEIIHLLEEKQIKPKDSTFVDCLKESIKCHQNEIANYIINNYIQNEDEQAKKVICMTSIKYYNFEFIKKDYINESTFFDLCKSDYFHFVQYLLKMKSVNINAIRSIHKEKVDLNYRQSEIYKSYKKTPLFVAVEKGNVEIVKLLIKEPSINPNIVSYSCNDNNNIDIHDFIYTYEEKTALYIAVENQDIEIIKLLLNNSKIDPNIKYSLNKPDFWNTEQSPLFSASKMENNEILKLLLENTKIDVNTIYFEERHECIIEKSFLDEIIYKSNYEILELLLKNPNIDINIKSTIEYKFESKREQYTALYEAIEYDDIRCVKLLLDNPQIDVNIVCHNEDNYDLTALHLAVEEDKVEIVKLLLSNNKTDVNIKTGRSIFPWYEKRWQKSKQQEYSKEDIEYIKEEEEEIRQQIAASERRTALHISVAKENIEIIGFLLRNPRIDVYVKDEKGRAPIDTTNNIQIKSLISNYVNSKNT